MSKFIGLVCECVVVVVVVAEARPIACVWRGGFELRLAAPHAAGPQEEEEHDEGGPDHEHGQVGGEWGGRTACHAAQHVRRRVGVVGREALDVVALGLGLRVAQHLHQANHCLCHRVES